eukprot:TRINITY_DN14580_c0_g1_i1.p1 TRINITY_DN14580_c0_g1~~TRINITY_DN14580_c0_g1_i1.p1  ORF type:complete len:257 (+),score=103.52 TRINITY_DN14580_c0_g1_i1:140-910(+)
MRFAAAVFVCLIGASAATGIVPTLLSIDRVGPKAIAPTAKPTDCPSCINLMIQFLDTFFDAIGNGGIIGGCEQLCGYVPLESEWAVCSAICMYVGIEEMVKFINVTDPDPVYMCEAINICPVSDTAAARINSVVVDPTTGPLGTTFYINMSFSIINETGTGYMQMWAVPPKTPYDDGLGEEAFLIEVPPGDYKVSFSLPTSDTQVDWLLGTYNCSVWLCEGYCDSIHKHQYVLATQGNLLFTVTKKQDEMLAIAPV